VKKLIVCLVAVAMLASATAQAQNQYEELLRQDIRAAKTEIVTEAMMLSSEEADAFWPVYREYELELATYWDARIALIEEYAQNYEKMDDATADAIMQKAMKLRKQREDLRQKYYKKMKKEVGAIVAARYAQVDNVLSSLVDLQISANLPLVIRTAAEGEGGH
jgi:hypothetical protein